MAVKAVETLFKASHTFAAFASSLGFNLDTEQLTRFHMDGGGFGHSVVQYDSTW